MEQKLKAALGQYQQWLADTQLELALANANVTSLTAENDALKAARVE